MSSSVLSASMLIQTSGPPGAGFGVILAVGWKQTVAAHNVSVCVPFYFEPPAGSSSVTAYLTTAIGPGATVANQVATSTVTITPSSGPSVSYCVFSGLDLAPGSYYLVINTGNQGIVWDGNLPATDRSTFVAPGFTVLGSFGLQAFSALSGYDPSDLFVPLTGFSPSNMQESAALKFTLSGDTASPPAVPAPASGGLALLGVTVAGCYGAVRILFKRDKNGNRQGEAA